jgi:hypothetical protein
VATGYLPVVGEPGSGESGDGGLGEDGQSQVGVVAVDFFDVTLHVWRNGLPAGKLSRGRRVPHTDLESPPGPSARATPGNIRRCRIATWIPRPHAASSARPRPPLSHASCPAISDRSRRGASCLARLTPSVLSRKWSAPVLTSRTCRGAMFARSGATRACESPRRRCARP